jgi:hypothetical protein
MIRTFSILFALVSCLAALGAGAFPTAAHATLPDTVYVRVHGGGRVVATPNHVCTSQCQYSYGEDSNALVNVVADPDPGWKFSHWDSLDPGNPNPTNDICYGSTTPFCQVNFATHPYVGAYFAAVFVPELQVLSTELSVSVAGGGKITGPGIDCPGDCTQSFSAFPQAQVVTLTAEPAPGFAFSGWSGACTVSAPTCVVLMSDDRSVGATFVPSISSATLSVSVVGGGTVTGQGIACPGDCSQTFVKQAGQPHAQVTLTATPNPGFELLWTGDCTGSQPTCVVTMSLNRSVTATFIPDVSGGPVTPGNPANPGGGNPGTPGSPGGGAPGAPSPGTPQNPPPSSPDVAAPPCTITGTPGNDVLRGTPGNDVICGLGGNDVIVGRGGDDILVGAAGADRLKAGPGKDLLLGGAGRDRLEGGAGADVLEAGAGNDRLVGSAGADRLVGGKGADLLLARDGLRDRIDGGRGRDTARIDATKDVKTRIESFV